MSATLKWTWPILVSWGMTAALVVVFSVFSVKFVGYLPPVPQRAIFGETARPRVIAYAKPCQGQGRDRDGSAPVHEKTRRQAPSPAAMNVGLSIDRGRLSGLMERERQTYRARFPRSHAAYNSAKN